MIGKLYEIKVRVVAEDLKPQPKQYSPASQQSNKGARHKHEKAIKPKVTKIQERTRITYKENVWVEIILKIVDWTALAIADPLAVPH